jgi:flagellar biosynthesis protein FlhG
MEYNDVASRLHLKNTAVRQAEIWAIGGGKGGVGKSFFSSFAGLDLAAHQKNVILIDADLGGANLHSFLNIKKPAYTLTDFFENKIPLKEIMVPSHLANLKFITGDIRSLNPENIKYAQRLKLYKHIKGLPADHILIDLGAGSRLDIIDTFLLADKMIVMTTPELTAIENLYHFIKKTLFRKINIILSHYKIKEIVRNAWKFKKKNTIHTISDFLDYIKSISEEISLIVHQELADFKIYLILNQVRNLQHIKKGFSIKSILTKYFGIQAFYAGYIEYDDMFWKYLSQNQSVMEQTYNTSILQEISSITDNLLNDKQVIFSTIFND